MRILFITNYYPPALYGWGYMQLCEEVVDGLSAHGHEITVLTSVHLDREETKRPYPVQRRINLDPDWYSEQSAARQFFFGRRKRERRAIADLQQLLASFDPAVIFIWHAIGLPKAMLGEAENHKKAKVVYYLADYQPELADEYVEYWHGKPIQPLARLFKGALARLALAMLAAEGKPIQLKYEHAICVSDFVRRRLVSKGLISKNAIVIHNGVDLSVFSPNSKEDFTASHSSFHCLVAGRIIPNKGVHTIIDAFALLGVQDPQNGISLTILGDGPADYLEALQRKIQENQLQEIIRFQPPIPRSQMPQELVKHDAFILSSEYEEPLARAIQEAMAMGLLVVGTTTGGSGELLIEDQTGLVFTAGDAQSLARQLKRAFANPNLVRRLRAAGRQAVETGFDIRRTVDQVERFLQEVTNPSNGSS